MTVTSGSDIRLEPTDKTHIGTWTVTTGWLPQYSASNYGLLQSWDAYTFDVGCTVLSFGSYEAPLLLTYLIFDKEQIMKFEGDFIQTPDCGYTYTRTMNHTIIPQGSGTCNAVSYNRDFEPAFTIHSEDGNDEQLC